MVTTFGVVTRAPTGTKMTTSGLRTLSWKTALVLAFAALAAALASGRGPSDTSIDVAPSELWPASGDVAMLVDLADDLSASERDAVLAELPAGFALNSAWSADEGLYRGVLSADAARSLAARLAGDDRIEFVEPDTVVALDEPGAIEVSADVPENAAFPNDPLYIAQWHFDQIDVEGAWTRSRGAGTVVAVIDTGVAWADSADGRYPQVRDLSGTAFVPGYDFVDDDDAPHDGHGHGTHVAGTIAQTTDNGYGVAGIAPAASIMPIRVLDDQGRGRTGDIADAIRYAADKGADIINMSLGGPLPSRVMMDAINYAHSRGVTVIAASGNNGSSIPSFPAAYPNVIAVGATQFDGSTTFYSNYGRHLDIAAPGGNTRVDQNNDGRPDGVLQETLKAGAPSQHEFALYMGTSMASPHAAGVAALVHSMGITHPDRIEEVLRATADDEVATFDPLKYGAGIVDAAAATAFVSQRVQTPRGLFAGLAALLLVAATGARRRPIAAGLTAATSVFVASGLALPLWLVGLFGVDVSCLAWASGSPLAWGSALSIPFVGTHALLWSAVPALTAYALFGGHEGRRVTALVVGSMVGIGALLVTNAIVPLVDVTWLPGAGCLDRVWMAFHGGLTLIVAAVGLRRR